MSETEVELKEMVQSSLRGDWIAKVRFQHLFGADIYSYPTKIFHISSDKAADFYVYIFEGDRIFKRLLSFEGRNNAHFRTYLGHYVLRDLFLEWQRSQKEPETVSLETNIAGNDSGETGVTLQDIIADPEEDMEASLENLVKAARFKDILASLDAEKKLVLKILHIAEFELNPQEIRLLRKKSGRTYGEIVAIVEEMRGALVGKDEKMASLQDQRDSVFGWILLGRKELTKIEEALQSSTDGLPPHTELRRRKEELQRKLEWRYRQHQRVIEKAGHFRITTPYKDIARLLNVPLGTVCSLIGRIREEILKAFSNLDVSGKAAAS